MNNMYEFSVYVDRNTLSIFYVVGRDPEEAINKFLDKHPDLYDFRITEQWEIDIM